ncbi:hypothetical protein [Idiomarina xiamenensis]|uniref:Uncharacterized protein n=1 Tax=Idiomarina xiamenensis 10-D-4 TaxID=740709 RepID=K2JLP4_9GAMM|nr:hypothetical protein [Idiomarina xiamenensis]EKE84421.1 hypothetical protein A10D4_05117 [Idiomarina xiamenensis 10-D-4]
MFRIFKKKEKLLLRVFVNKQEVCQVLEGELPCEKTPSKKLDRNSTIEFVDHEGVAHQHKLGEFEGWFHFSVRVHSNKACQADCAITQEKEYSQDAFAKGNAKGIRFQPFFISGADTKNEIFIGKGLFKRGLHFNGNVTHGAVSLSCECEHCKTSFLIQSFHAGFSNLGYFYSGSGDYTLTVSDKVPGSPAALSELDEKDLRELEALLPEAPDGSSFKYTNPFRCPHCKEPYIDFGRYPEERKAEYYGNYFPGKEILKYEPDHG